MRWSKEPPFNYREWHAWFAWHVVKCEGENVWLETIERRRSPYYRDGGYDWEYQFFRPQHPVTAGWLPREQW